MRGNDHLVAGSDPCRERRDSERRGARGNAHAVAYAAVGRELLLEAGHLLAEDVRTGTEDALEGRAKVSRNRLMLAGQVYEWNLIGHGVPRAPVWHANPSISM